MNKFKKDIHVSIEIGYNGLSNSNLKNETIMNFYLYCNNDILTLPARF